MNKNISVWRGILPPPTHYHIWIKDDESVPYEYKIDRWVPMIATTEKSGFMSKTDKEILDMLNTNLHWN